LAVGGDEGIVAVVAFEEEFDEGEMADGGGLLEWSAVG